MKKLTSAIVFILFISTTFGQVEVEGRYFKFKGQPVIVNSHSPHYGALINVDVDYETQNDSMAARGYNAQRIFGGTFIANYSANVANLGSTIRTILSPSKEDALFPWARIEGSDPDSYYDGDLFDLSTWDETYWSRAIAFCEDASSKGLMVEYVFVSTMYSDSNWYANPLYYKNNNTSVSADTYDKLIRDDGTAFSYLDALFDETLYRLRNMDNVYYSIRNEGHAGNGNIYDFAEYFANKFAAIMASDSVRDTWPHKFILAHEIGKYDQVATFTNGTGFSKNDTVIQQIWEYHYNLDEFAYVQATLIDQYKYGKPILTNENGLRGSNEDWKYQQEPLLAFCNGGAGLISLGFDYGTLTESGYRANPANYHPGGYTFRSILSFEKKLIDSLPFTQMIPNNVFKDSTEPSQGSYEDVFYLSGTPNATTAASMMYKEGSHYFGYIYDNLSTANYTSGYEYNLVLKPGSYEVKYINPSTRSYTSKTILTDYAGGTYTATTPAFVRDIVIWAERTDDYNANMVGQWKLDETTGVAANDHFGNKNGTLLGGGFSFNTASATVGGRTGLQFNGTSHYIDLDDVLDVGGNSFTVTFWYYQTDSIGGNEFLVSKEQGGDSGWNCRLINGRLAASARSAQGNTTVFADSPANDAWHFVANVFDRENKTLTIYTDTIQTGQRYMEPTTLNNDFKLLIGAYPSEAPTEFFEGIISDIRIFDVAKTQNQLGLIYTE